LAVVPGRHDPGQPLAGCLSPQINWQQTVQICKDYEFLVLFTSTLVSTATSNCAQDQGSEPSMKVAFVGPHGHIKPDETLNASEDIDFIVRAEFDHAVTEFAHGKPLDQILNASYKKDGKIVTTRRGRNCTRKSWMRCRSRRTFTKTATSKLSAQRAVPAEPLRIVL